MAAVTIGTSGWCLWKFSTPSGHASRVTSLSEPGLERFTRSMAATAELPVASIGSHTMTSRSWSLLGTL